MGRSIRVPGSTRRQRQPRRRVVSMLGAPMALILTAILVSVALHPTSAQQEQDPDINASLNAVNTYRSWLGMQPMTIDPSLQAAAEAHAEYYRLNFGDPHLAGMGLHREKPGNPGFTGETMRDRARTQGYQGSVNENIGLSGSMFRSVQWFMGTINHRLTLLDPRYTEVGMARINDGDIRFEVILFGMPEWSETAEPEFVVWPPDNATGVGRWFQGEAPNPFPGASFPTGYPITISYHGPGQIALNDWTMTSGGQEVASFGSVGTGFLSSRTGQIAASEPLAPGTTYRVQASGTAGGEAFSYDWSFTTRSDASEPLALNGEAPTEDDAGQPEQPSPSPTPTPEPEQPSPTPTPEPEPGETPTPDQPEVRDAAQVEPPEFLPEGEIDPSSPYPPGIQWSAGDVQELWWESDGPVYRNEVGRSWLWGPDTWAGVLELYVEAPGGDRRVRYFDKARLESSEQGAEITAGLLVRDMILGSVQVGDNQFNSREPADIPLAGDGKEFNEHAPTYASLRSVASIGEASETGNNRAEERTGEPIIETINSSGQVGTYPAMEGEATYGSYESTLGHNIATAFEDYFETLAVDWKRSVGLPLAEPYWIKVNVSFEPTWVLVQAFERRVLTYTPSNEEGWQVEMGNVGRHYFEWRYQREAPPLPGTE